MSSNRLFTSLQILGRTLKKQLSAVLSALRTKVYDPVRVPYDLQIVLYYYHGIARIHQRIQYCEEALYVAQMQTRGRLIHYVDIAFPAELLGDFQALAFSSGEVAQGLAELEVAKAHPLKQGKQFESLRLAGKELRRLIHRHIQNLCNILSLIKEGQGLGVVALAPALVAPGMDRIQEAHLIAQVPAASALRAGAFGIEAEQAGRLSTCRGKELAYMIEYPEEGGDRSARGASYRLLVYDYYCLRVLGGEAVVHQAALSASRNAGDAGQHALRNLHAQVLCKNQENRAQERRKCNIQMRFQGKRKRYRLHQIYGCDSYRGF